MHRVAFSTTNDAVSGTMVHSATPRRPWLHAACTLLVIALVLATACVHYEGQTLARGPDQADILLSIFYDASRAVREEGLLAAMYTPGLQAGIANWSNPHQHPLYPLYFNWLGGDATVFDTLDRLNWIIYLHLAILGGGAFQLARCLGVRLLPAIAVGLVLPWFPAIRSAAAWPQIIAGLAWLPWLLAGQLRLYAAIDRRDVIVGVSGTALTATLLVYAHPAQNLVFAVFASAMTWLIIAIQTAWRRDPLALRRFAVASGWLAVAALIVVVLAGGYLVEILRFHEHSIRWLGRYGGHIVGEQAIPVGALRLHALGVDDAGLLAAFEYRKGIGNAYLGVALVIASASLAAARATIPAGAAAARALLACAFVTILFCFSFMAPLVSMIPVANKVREVSWWSCLAIVVITPLAALGLQVLGERASTGRPQRMRDPWPWMFAAGFVLALVATSIAATTYRIEAAVVLAIGFSVIGWMLLARGSRAMTRDIACVLALACAVWIPFRHNIEFARGDATLFEADRVQARADAARLSSRLPDEESFRIALGGGLPNAHLLTHAYANRGFRSTSGGIGPFDYGKYRLFSNASPVVSALYGVKYHVLPDGAARPGDLKLRNGLWLRTDPSALPRLFFLGGGLRVVKEPVETLRTSDITTPAVALVAPRDLPESFDINVHARGTARVVLPRVSENRRTRLRATFASEGAGLLVLNEDPDARWRARIDGKPVIAFRINGFQTAFAIPAAGRHEVDISRPGHLFERIH